MKTSGLTPTKLRIILSVCMFLLIGAGVGLFMVGYTVIADYSAAARTTAAQAQASNTTLQDLKTTEAQLKANAKTVARASQERPPRLQRAYRQRAPQRRLQQE